MSILVCVGLAGWIWYSSDIYRRFKAPWVFSETVRKETFSFNTKGLWNNIPHMMVQILEKQGKRSAPAGNFLLQTGTNVKHFLYSSVKTVRTK